MASTTASAVEELAPAAAVAVLAVLDRSQRLDRKNAWGSVLPVSEVAEAFPAEAALLLLRVQLLQPLAALVEATFPVDAALLSPKPLGSAEVKLAEAAALPLRVLMEVVLPAQNAATAEEEDDEEEAWWCTPSPLKFDKSLSPRRAKAPQAPPRGSCCCCCGLGVGAGEWSFTDGADASAVATESSWAGVALGAAAAEAANDKRWRGP